MSNEVSHSDLCYSLPRLIQIKIPSATVYFAFCMLQFSVIASFPGPVQQMTEIWVGLGTWLSLQEDKVRLCYFQGCGTAKVLYRDLLILHPEAGFMSSPVQWRVTANEECGFNIIISQLGGYLPSAIDITVHKSCQSNQVCTLLLINPLVSNNM